jgi:hypothetical protein
MREEHRPVTLAEFKAGKQEFKDDVGQMKAEIEGFMRQIETNILTAFHGYARGVSTHLHTLDVGDQDLRLRLNVLEDRVLALETRPSHG